MYWRVFYLPAKCRIVITLWGTSNLKTVPGSIAGEVMGEPEEDDEDEDDDDDDDVMAVD